MNERLTAVALSAALLAGCGGGAAGNAPSKAPPASEAPAGGYPQQQQPGQPGYGAPAPRDEGYDFAEPPAAEEAGPGDDKDSATRSVEDPNLELDRAASELSAAGTDCARVCKALGSMNRASERICALEPETSSSRCRRARERVAEAAGRVRRSCTCP